jgi:hypothetical protein
MSPNNEVMKKLRDLIEKGGTIDAATRDILLFTAIIDMNTQLETLQPVLAFYKVGMWFAGVFGVSLIGLIWGMLTGQVEIVFK